ncbi:hypothetical protein ACFY89_08725 [Achromobacter spanius]|uniref:hypothetical protein n=1 Tax=Achromobacter spanius TaxID=217203 RepID=UPI0036E60ACB
MAETQGQLQRLSDARISGSTESPEARIALVKSYMQASGEHQYRAEDVISHAVSVLVAGVRGAIKDNALGGQLEISMLALQQRFDELDIRLNAQSLAEPGWSLEVACKANEDWLQSVFSSRGKAKTRLGQPLSPADRAAPAYPMPRADLTERFKTLLGELPFGGVVALTGHEGNGKSWLVAQAWLSLPIKPLTLFLTAEDVGEQISDPLVLIARKLCVQTDRQGSERHREFWSSQLVAWRSQRLRPAQGFVVVLDGLNQRPRTEWARVIDQLSEGLEPIGGKLVLTSRKQYFDGRIKPRLVAPRRELGIPEWTPHERDAILAARDILGDRLPERVAAPLCNPRLLGITLAMFDSAQLQALEELSIPILLFEHLRASHRDSYDLSAEHFKRSLQNHASQVLQRLSTQQRDDLDVFDGGLDAVMEGRFFEPLAEDLNRYSIKQEGLSLALGLEILERLQTARRNGRDLNETLAVLAEPIGALDQTSQAIQAALTVACLSEGCSTDVGVAILIEFASLQNVADDIFDEIAGLARIRPPVFLEAARMLALQGSGVGNSDWIELALHHVKVDPHAWQTIAPAIGNWLEHVTLNIEKRVFSHGKSPDEMAKQRLRLQDELNAKLAGLSSVERDILDALEQTTGQNVSGLGVLSLKLLAGMPLAQFAQALLRWSFARSLNGNYDAPSREFRQLIRYNSLDWQATRSALQHSSQLLRDGTPSSVGQWTLVSLLHATGHPDDARYAQELVDVLRAGQPAGTKWRLVESYCSTDPCDPKNSEPDNVAQTAEAYAAADVAKLYLHMGMDTEDHFFSKGRPAVSRYYPAKAIEQHRALIDDVLHRTGLPLRQGVFALLPHSALITHEQAQSFVRRVCGCEADVVAQSSLGDEANILMQLQLQLAFPALEARDQLDALIMARFGEKLMLNLIEMIKPLEVQDFESRLAYAMAERDNEAQFIVLLFSPFFGQALSQKILGKLPILLRSESALVRTHTLRMVSQSGDTDALRIVVQTGWHTARLSKTGKVEHWYGSEVLLAAAVKGVLPWETLVTDMEVQHLGQLARCLGGDAARHVAGIVDVLIQCALELPIATGALEIKLMQRPDGGPHFQYFSLNERELPSANADEAWQRVFKQKDDFDERQKNMHAAFDVLLESLTQKNAGRLLDQFCMEDFAAIVEADATLTKRWCELLLNTPEDANLGAVRNIGLLMARAVAARNPAHAVQLFEKFDPIVPLVRVVFGQTAIELSAMAVWGAADSSELDELRMRRLDRATNNDALACEVWSALWNEKSTQLKQYIDQRLASEWPVAQSRAILTAGLMGKNPHSDQVLKKFANVPGMLGETQCVAQEVYDRHSWTVHWSSVMRAASSVEAFWSAAVLFLIAADGRVEALKLAQQEAKASFCLHWSSIERELKRRFDKQRKKSKECLFAEEAPWPPFLTLSAHAGRAPREHPR